MVAQKIKDNGADVFVVTALDEVACIYGKHFFLILCKELLIIFYLTKKGSLI